jgi:hypothetical protein
MKPRKAANPKADSPAHASGLPTIRLWESSYVPLLSSHFNLRLRRLRFLADGSMI